MKEIFATELLLRPAQRGIENIQALGGTILRRISGLESERSGAGTDGSPNARTEKPASLRKYKQERGKSLQAFFVPEQRDLSARAQKDKEIKEWDHDPDFVHQSRRFRQKFEERITKICQ